MNIKGAGNANFHKSEKQASEYGGTVNVFGRRTHKCAEAPGVGLRISAGAFVLLEATFTFNQG